MKKAQSGFTLIELVMVIVIMGILAAVALPKFSSLSEDAKSAAAQGVASAMASSAVIKYAAHAISSGIPALTDCSDTTGMQSGTAGYSFTPATNTASGSECSVKKTDGGVTATWILIN